MKLISRVNTLYRMSSLFRKDSLKMNIHDDILSLCFHINFKVLIEFNWNRRNKLIGGFKWGTFVFKGNGFGKRTACIIDTIQIYWKSQPACFLHKTADVQKISDVLHFNPSICLSVSRDSIRTIRYSMLLCHL